MSSSTSRLPATQMSDFVILTKIGKYILTYIYICITLAKVNKAFIDSSLFS